MSVSSNQLCRLWTDYGFDADSWIWLYIYIHSTIPPGLILSTITDTEWAYLGTWWLATDKTSYLCNKKLSNSQTSGLSFNDSYTSHTKNWKSHLDWYCILNWYRLDNATLPLQSSFSSTGVYQVVTVTWNLKKITPTVAVFKMLCSIFSKCK